MSKFWRLVDMISAYLTMRKLRKTNPELYKLVTEPFSLDDFTEVQAPNGITLRVHKDALEILRKLEEDQHREPE